MISACSPGNQNQEYDRGDPLSGYFTIATDPAYLPLVKVLAETYMGLYPLVAIKLDTSKTGNPFQWTVDSTIRMVVTGMELSEKDSLALVSRALMVKVSPIATDGLVLISSKSSEADSSKSFSLRHDSCFYFNGIESDNTMLTDKYTSEELSKAFYNIACSYNVSVGTEVTTINISGLQENFDKALHIKTLYVLAYKNPASAAQSRPPPPAPPL